MLVFSIYEMKKTELNVEKIRSFGFECENTKTRLKGRVDNDFPINFSTFS